MTLAYDYPLLGIFWTMLVFFIWIVWILALFHVFADIFRSHDMNGWVKAIWVLFVIVMPYLGVFVYLIARGHKMSEHAVADAKAQDEAARAYIRQAASSPEGVASELEKLAGLRDSGVITPEEFEAQKASLLAK